MADFKGRKRGKSHVQNMGIFFGGSGHGSESSCQISAYYKFFSGFACILSYFYRTKTLSLFSQHEFLEKGVSLPKLVRSCVVTGKVNIIPCFIFRESSGRENRFRVSKSFFEDIPLYLLNIFATADPNENKKFQKLYFDFGYCKLPELASCLTPFKCFFGLYTILVVVLIVLQP